MRHVKFHLASNLKNLKGGKSEEDRRGKSPFGGHWLCLGPGEP